MKLHEGDRKREGGGRDEGEMKEQHVSLAASPAEQTFKNDSD